MSITATAELYIIVSLCHEWRRAGLLHGNLTCDAFLAFLSQILHTVQQTD